MKRKVVSSPKRKKSNKMKKQSTLRDETTQTTRAPDTSSKQGGEGVFIGVLQEIPVTSKPIVSEILTSQAHKKRVNVSRILLALNLPLTVSVSERNKGIVTSEEQELSELEKIQLQIK